MLIHSGSRGLGHQVCTDYVGRMDAAQERYGIRLPDRQLACAPRRSPGGPALPRRDGAPPRTSRFANRHAIAHARPRGGRARARARRRGNCARSTTSRTTSPRSSATATASAACTARARRAPSGRLSRRSPRAYRDVGQPVFIPGSMGTARYVLAGDPARWSARSGASATAPAARCRRRRAKQADHRRRAAGASSRRGGSWFAARRTRASPRRRRWPTRTSIAWSTSSRARASRARVARLVPLGVVKG